MTIQILAPVDSGVTNKGKFQKFKTFPDASRTGC